MGEHESGVCNNNNNTCASISRQNPFTCTQTSIS